MLNPFLVSSLKIPFFLPPTPASQPTHSLFLALAFPYTGAQNLHRTKDSPPSDDQPGHPPLHIYLEQ